MVDKNDHLLREVDEELRRDRLEKLWKDHSSKLLMAAAAFVVAVGGYQAWQARRVSLAQSAGASYVEARRLIADGKQADATKQLETLAKGGEQGFASLSLLQLAGADLKAGRNAEALADFEKLANSTSADPLLRDYARLQAAALRLGEADFTEMQNRLNAMLAGKGPWKASAQELFGLAAMKAGKPELARGTFQMLLGERNTPPGIAERARIAMAQLVENELAQPPAVQPAAAGASDTKAGDSKAAPAAPAAGGTTAPAGKAGESRPAATPK